MFKMDVQMVFGNEIPKPFGPFDDERALSEHRVKVELLSFGHRVEAIGIQMEKLPFIGASIKVDKNERRA